MVMMEGEQGVVGNESKSTKGEMERREMCLCWETMVMEETERGQEGIRSREIREGGKIGSTKGTLMRG